MISKPWNKVSKVNTLRLPWDQNKANYGFESNEDTGVGKRGDYMEKELMLALNHRNREDDKDEQDENENIFDL